MGPERAAQGMILFQVDYLEAVVMVFETLPTRSHPALAELLKLWASSLVTLLIGPQPLSPTPPPLNL